MIRSFRSRALRRFWEKDDSSKINADLISRITKILDLLDAAGAPGDMALPGPDFHALKGSERGRYAVKMPGNGRITLAWDDGDAIEIDLEDCH